jgi:hypothetical protein
VRLRNPRAELRRWPPTLFQGEHYVDSGFYSSNNPNLATGFDRVMILALRLPPGVPSMSLVSIDVGEKMVRAAVRCPTHVMRPHEWGTRGMSGLYV